MTIDSEHDLLKRLVANQREFLEIARRYAQASLPSNYTFDQYNDFVNKLMKTGNVAYQKAWLAQVIDGQDPLRLLIQITEAPPHLWMSLMALLLEIQPYDTWITNFDVALPASRLRIYEGLEQFNGLDQTSYRQLVARLVEISEKIKDPEQRANIRAYFRVRAVLVNDFLKRYFEDRISSSKPSKAMIIDPNTGGIDLTSDRLDVDVRNGGEVVALNVDQAQMADMDLNGLSAQIMEIKPVNLAAFLGVSLLDASPKPR